MMRTYEGTDSNHVAIVYVIAPTCGYPCKVGYTENIEVRLASLQTGCWEPLTIHGFRVGIEKSGGVERGDVFAALLRGAQSLEYAAHETLKECDVWIRGEWFDVTAEDALRVIDKCGARKNVQPLTFNMVNNVMVHPKSQPDVAHVRDVIVGSLQIVLSFVAFRQPYPPPLD